MRHNASDNHYYIEDIRSERDTFRNQTYSIKYERDAYKLRIRELEIENTYQKSKYEDLLSTLNKTLVDKDKVTKELNEMKSQMDEIAAFLVNDLANKESIGLFKAKK
jgi:hypothetical protein